MKFLNHTLEHVMSFHVLFVVLLILRTDDQLNFWKFFEQQLSLIKVTDKHFNSLTSHSSIGFLSKD
jgi:hypothetical protein